MLFRSVIPATIGAMLLSKPIVDLLFLRGEFTQAASLMTSKALFYYSIGMLFFALSMIFGRVFYSYNDTKTPMVVGIIGVVINIVLNILLIGPLGIGGLALATSLSSAASTSILILRLRKKIPSFGFKEVLGKMIKITLASLIMGAEVYLSFNYFNSFMSQNLSAILSIATGGIVYLGIILVIGIDEVKDVIEMAKARIGKK